MIRIAIVSKLYPLTHYTLYLGRAILEVPKYGISLLFYRSKSEKVSLDLNEVKDVWSQNVLYPLQIFREVLRDRPNVVHVQHEFNMFGGPSTAAVFPVLLVLLKIARVRTIVTLHAIVSPRIVNGEFTRAFGMPNILWPLLRLGFALIYRSTTLLSSSLIVHAGVFRATLQSFYSATPDKTNVIPIGVPTFSKQMRHSRKWRDILQGRNVILFFGYLNERKGVEYLLRAFAKLAAVHSDWVLVVAGGRLNYSSRYIGTLRELIRDLEINDKVVMVTTTPFPLDELDELFELSDFVVLPYKISISGSLVLSFAIQHAKPVILTDSNVMRELVRDKEEGLFCKSGDVESLRNAMIEMIQDVSQRRKFSRAMREKASGLAWTHVADMTSNLYVETARP